MTETTLSRRRALAMTAGLATAAGMGASLASAETVTEGWPGTMPDYDSFATAVQSEAARWNIPGMTAAVLHNGERTLTSTGVTSLEYPSPVTPETRFQIGSITKTFTATVVMALVDDGLLDLDTPVWEWVPDLPIQRPDDFADLSLRHLLNHTTGFDGDYFFDEGDGDDALARSIARFDEVHPWTRPGEVVAYCNLAFGLAGRIVELATGMVYEDVVTERIFAPLGMESASFPSSEIATWPAASGHVLASREAGYQIPRPWQLPHSVNAAGGIVSTIDDLLSYAEMHLNDGSLGGNRVISEESAQEMRVLTSYLHEPDEGYGVGWNIVDLDGVPLVNHGGATNGFRAWLLTVPDHDFALAMLTNSDQGLHATDAVETWALRHYLGIEKAERTGIESDPAELDAVAGRYERHDATTDVWRVDDHLHIETQFAGDDEILVNTGWPIGDGVFIDLNGAPHLSDHHFLEAPIFGEGDDLVVRPLLRYLGGLLAERTGDAPAGGPTVTG